MNHAQQNLLLRVAARGRRLRLLQELRPVTFEAGQHLLTAGDQTSCLLFPVQGIVSVQILVSPAKQANVALVGREGFLEVSTFLGAQTVSMSAIAVTAGESLTMPTEVFRTFLASAAFRSAIEHYAESFVMMLARISSCNRLHVIEQVCAGRLLLMQDRTQATSFSVTQNFLSRLLGVRRASVSRAAARLQKLGAIQYDRRGRLTILDRDRLERFCCPCYRALKGRFDQLVVSGGGW